ncbi:MAG: hypothetical protein PHN75_08325 [Syntrophales bacterium]|nr:hypothetical protein [Syntrophales bacterium]
MFKPRFSEGNQRERSWYLRGITCIIMLFLSAILFAACQKSEAPPASGTPQKAVSAAPQKDASGADPNELDYDKAMSKKYPEGAPINVTGKVMQIVDEKSILMATRKDDVFGYLDNMVTVTFPDKPNVSVGDIIKAKSKNGGIKKYKTEGKGEYDAPFLKGETFEVLEKAKPAK